MFTITMHNSRGEKNHTVRLNDYEEAALFSFIKKQMFEYIDGL